MHLTLIHQRFSEGIHEGDRQVLPAVVGRLPRRPGSQYRTATPDGGVFAYSVLLSAIALMLIICSDLSNGRINATGDIMRAIESRRSLRLTVAAYLLGCSMVASVTVLIYRLVGHW